TWFFLHSLHPVNFSFASVHNFQNEVTSTSIDIQAIITSTENWIFMAGAGGAMYFGGFVADTGEGQGGPDLGIYYRPWQMGVSAQAGYGSPHQYGQISIYKQLTFFE